MVGLKPFGTLPLRAGQGQLSLKNLTYRLINHRFLKPGTTHELDIPILGVVFESYGPLLIPSSQYLETKTKTKTNTTAVTTEASAPPPSTVAISRLPSTSKFLNKLKIPVEDLRLQNGCLDFLKFLDSRDIRRGVINRGEAPYLQRLNELIGKEHAFPLQLGNDVFHRRVKPESVFVAAKKWGFPPPNLLFVSSSLGFLSRIKCTGAVTCLLSGEEELGMNVSRDLPSAYAYNQKKLQVNPLKKAKSKQPRQFVPDITVESYSALQSRLEGGEATADYIEPIRFTDVEIAKLLSFTTQKIALSRD